LATVIGAGFASGREVMVFFTRFGAWSWVGIAVATAAFGVLAAGVTRLSEETGAGSFAELCEKILGRWGGRACAVLYGVLMAVTAGAMASGVGEIAGLTMTAGGAYWLGLGGAVVLGAVWARRGMGALAAGGGFLLPVCGLLYVVIAWQGRRLGYAIAVREAGGGVVGVPMAVGYACLNVTLSCGVLCEVAGKERGVERGRVVGWFAAMVGGMLAAANATLLPNAARVGSAALPMLALARGVVPAAILATAAMLVAMMTTLVALLRSLAMMMKVGGDWVGYAVAAAVAAVCGAVGFNRIIGVAYPLMGWMSAAALLILLVVGAKWRNNA
jgi:uncharacterized membrane protein YkvI